MAVFWQPLVLAVNGKRTGGKVHLGCTEGYGIGALSQQVGESHTAPWGAIS